MFGIKAVVDSEYAYDFLYDCVTCLRKNITALEEFEERKLKTGVGPNKFDFQRIIKSTITKEDYEYWMVKGEIFKYHEQLKDIFYRYQYRMNSKGF